MTKLSCFIFSWFDFYRIHFPYWKVPLDIPLFISSNLFVSWINPSDRTINAFYGPTRPKCTRCSVFALFQPNFGVFVGGNQNLQQWIRDVDEIQSKQNAPVGVIDIYFCAFWSRFDGELIFRNYMEHTRDIKRLTRLRCANICKQILVVLLLCA